MKRGQYWGMIAAYILAAVCYLLSQSVLQNSAFSATAAYRADQAPTFKAFQNLERGDDILAITAWADAGEGQLQGEFSQTAVHIFRFAGDVSPILPGRLISGNAFAGDDGAFIDENTAFALFGNTDAAGSQIVLNGKMLTVQGVFQMDAAGRFLEGGDQGIALIPPDEKFVLQKVGLCLTEATQHAAERVENALRPLGRPSGIQDSEQALWFVALFGKLPFLVLGLGLTIALGRTIKRALSQTRDVLRMILLAAYWCAALMLILRLYGPSNIPVSWVPTKWSDFSQWIALGRNLLVGFLKRQPPVLPTETLEQLFRVGIILCCALSITFRPAARKFSLPAACVCFLVVGGLSLLMAGMLNISAAAAWMAWMTTAGFMTLAAFTSRFQPGRTAQPISEGNGK